MKKNGLFKVKKIQELACKNTFETTLTCHMKNRAFPKEVCFKHHKGIPLKEAPSRMFALYPKLEEYIYLEQVLGEAAINKKSQEREKHEETSRNIWNSNGPAECWLITIMLIISIFQLSIVKLHSYYGIRQNLIDMFSVEKSDYDLGDEPQSAYFEAITTKWHYYEWLNSIIEKMYANEFISQSKSFFVWQNIWMGPMQIMQYRAKKTSQCPLDSTSYNCYPDKYLAETTAETSDITNEDGRTYMWGYYVDSDVSGMDTELIGEHGVYGNSGYLYQVGYQNESYQSVYSTSGDIGIENYIDDSTYC